MKKEFSKKPPREFKKEKEELESKLLDLARVTKVTGGGKNLKFRAVIVAGDKKGKVGI
ncbi:MAG: 30S ribosomal protein S5, partial [Candidatus Pacebacteria bacterium]|nr:30S ribosomal protein S5 [Candidatus Paceibacterota bacterium]